MSLHWAPNDPKPPRVESTVGLSGKKRIYIGEKRNNPNHDLKKLHKHQNIFSLFSFTVYKKNYFTILINFTYIYKICKLSSFSFFQDIYLFQGTGSNDKSVNTIDRYTDDRGRGDAPTQGHSPGGVDIAHQR